MFSTNDAVWLRFYGQFMTELDKKAITEGDLLNDRHINHAQQLIHDQFPNVKGLGHTLLQEKKDVKRIADHGLQIIFDRNNHWVVASNIYGCQSGVVNLYDSMYFDVHHKTEKIVKKMFGASSIIKIMNVQNQVGVQDCGLFAIAIATALVHDEDASSVQFNQSKMRDHLLQCFIASKVSLFPELRTDNADI